MTPVHHALQVEVVETASRLHAEYCIPALLSAAAENPGESGVFILGGKETQIEGYDPFPSKFHVKRYLVHLLTNGAKMVVARAM